MRYRLAIGPNFDKDHIARAKHHSSECLNVDVVTDHDDGRLRKLLQTLLYELTQPFGLLV